MEWQVEQIVAKRPGGVTAIAGLNLFGAIVAVILAATGGVPNAEPGLLLIAAVLGASVGAGLLAQQRWARWAAILGYGINAMAALAEHAAGGVVVAAAIMAYLAFNEDVRRAFAKPAVAEAVAADTPPAGPPM